MSEPIEPDKHESTQHPFQIETEDGTVIGGAASESDACVLVAGAVGLIKGTLYVREQATGTVTAQIGRTTQEQPTAAAGPSLVSINPASQDAALGMLQILTCTGTGFEQGAEILFDDVRQTTTFTDETTVSARLDYTGAPGEKCAVQVRNPDGETSGTLYFEFLAP